MSYRVVTLSKVQLNFYTLDKITIGSTVGFNSETIAPYM